MPGIDTGHFLGQISRSILRYGVGACSATASSLMNSTMETGREHSRCDAVHKEVAVVVEGAFVGLVKEEFQTATGVKLECARHTSSFRSPVW
jgi:hypothetical protein